MKDKIRDLFISFSTLYLLLELLKRIKLETRGINQASILKFVYILGIMLIVVYFREILTKIKEFLDKNRLKNNTNKKNESLENIYKKTGLIVSGKNMKFLIAPLFLLYLGIRLTLLSLSSSGEKLHILSQNISISSINKMKIGELFIGDSISGEFTAKENNLGTLSISFETFNRQNTGVIVFRIREKEKESWFYSNEYSLSKIPPKELFPFGFPKISDSKGKNYVWEVVSNDGQKGDAVGLNQIDFPIKLKYEFDMQSIIKNPANFILFSYSKIIDLIFESGYLIYLLIFFSPLLFYYSGIFLTQFSIASYFYVFLITLLVLADFFVIKVNNDYIFATISILWLLVCWFFGYSGKISVSVGLFFILLIPFYLIFGNEIMAEKVGIWAYLILLCGTILIVLRKDNKEIIGNEKQK